MLRAILAGALFVAVIAADVEIEENLDQVQPEEKSEELQKKSSNYCYNNGRILRNGEETRMRGRGCAIYRCQYGRLRFARKECEVNGQCHPVDSTWTDKCVKYKCETRRGRRGVSYDAKIISSKCIDAHGNCRQPGERFTHTLGGRYHNRCTCRQWRERNKIKTKYIC